MTAFIAVDEKTGEIVPVGSEVTDFRGEKATLVSIDRARGPYRSGKITCVYPDGHGWSYYDGVFGIRVEEAVE